MIDRGAHLVQQAVGCGFPGFGALGDTREGGVGAGKLQLQHAVAHARGQLDQQRRVLARQLEQVALGAVEVVRQLGPHLVADQRIGLGREHAFGTGAHDEFQEGQRALAAEHVAQILAEARRAFDRELHRVVDQDVPADLEEGHVAVAVVRGPLEHRNAVALAHERSQALARAVPVDQKHQARTEELQVLRELPAIARVVAADTQMVDAALVQAAFAARAGFLPMHREFFEQALEEQQPLQVHVGIGDGRNQACDMHHQHVRIGHADIVLQDELPAAQGGRGPQSRMVELECLGRVQAAHEGAHQFLVLGAQAVDARAIHALARQVPLQAVQGLVQVHHQEVRRVAALALARSQG